MKKLFFLFCLVLAIASFAQTDAGKRTGKKVLTAGGPNNTIILNEGVNLIFLDDVTDDIFIEGKREAVVGVTVNFEAGDLTICNSKKKETTSCCFYFCTVIKKNDH